ncbi:MAG: ATP-binding protein [Clostridia bacterium]|nr:ATP-binding protein [Clostridia bacterium]
MLDLKEKIISSKSPIIAITGNIFDIFPPYRNLHEYLKSELKPSFESIEFADSCDISNDERMEKYRAKNEMLLDLEGIKKALDESISLCVVIDISASADGYAKESFLLGMCKLFYDDSLGQNKIILIAKPSDYEMIKQFGSAVEGVAVGLPRGEEIEEYLVKICPELDAHKIKQITKTLLDCDFRKIKAMTKELYQMSIDNTAFYNYLEKNSLNEQIEKISFDDVAGLENVKDEIKKSIFVVQNRNDLEAYEKNVPNSNSLLLAGLPGTGKTYITRAISSELDAKFIEFKLSDILSEYYGVSERNVAEFFASIEECASKQKCVVFFDEADAIMSKRNDHDTTSNRVVSVFLTHLQKILTNPNVLVVLATNRPWNIDSGITRSKRIEKSLYVPLPDSNVRKQLIKIKEKGRVEIDYDLIAEKTENFNSADVCTLYSSANIERSKRKGNVLETQDFIKALEGARTTVRNEDIAQMKKWIQENNIKADHI